MVGGFVLPDGRDAAATERSAAQRSARLKPALLGQLRLRCYGAAL